MTGDRKILTPVRFYILVSLVAWLAIVLIHFPYHTDIVYEARHLEKSIAFYDRVYQPPAPGEEEDVYVKIEKLEAKGYHIEEMVRSFAVQYGLQSKKVLDVGAGRGNLQDIVPDYTGLDISPSVGWYFHKPFVQASATEMPFRDNEFDAVWTIWVLEHVPGPESALTEMRRVVKDGGLLFLAPAWKCISWAADGYDVRPYSNFGWTGKVTKASLRIRKSLFFQMSYTYPERVIRSLASRIEGTPTAFHYRVLEPNYTHYWQPDSDAVNSMDSYEAYLWFLSRGDECLNCDGGIGEMLKWERWPMIVRVHKARRHL